MEQEEQEEVSDRGVGGMEDSSRLQQSADAAWRRRRRDDRRLVFSKSLFTKPKLNLVASKEDASAYSSPIGYYYYYHLTSHLQTRLPNDDLRDNQQVAQFSRWLELHREHLQNSLRTLTNDTSAVMADRDLKRTVKSGAESLRQALDKECKVFYERTCGDIEELKRQAEERHQLLLRQRREEEERRIRKLKEEAQRERERQQREEEERLRRERLERLERERQEKAAKELQAQREKKEEEERQNALMLLKEQQKQKEEAEERERLRLEHLKKEREEAQQTTAKSEPSAKNDHTGSTTPDADTAHVKQAFQMVDTIRAYEEHELKRLLENVASKSVRMNIRKSINTAYSRLSSLQSQVHIVLETLCQDLLKLRQGGHCELLKYALYSLTNELLKQCAASGSISVCPSCVWAYGWVLNGIAREFPEFTDIFAACTFKACSYAVPFYYRKLQDMPDFHQIRGQMEGEEEEDFFRRMAVILRVWIATIVLKNEWQELWMWFARFINLNAKKARRVSIILLLAALEVGGFDALQQFGRQFHKVLFNCHDVLLPRMKTLLERKPSGISAAFSQLEELLVRYRRGRRLEAPDGKDMRLQAEPPRPNF